MRNRGIMDNISLQIEIDQLKNENQRLKNQINQMIDYIHHIRTHEHIHLEDTDNKDYPDFNITPNGTVTFKC